MTNVAPVIRLASAPSKMPAQDDRLLAAVAHLSLFTGLWLVGPVAVYAIKRKESHFAAFHGLQAAIAHALFGALMTGGTVAFFVVSAIIGATAASHHEV